MIWAGSLAGYLVDGLKPHLHGGFTAAMLFPFRCERRSNVGNHRVQRVLEGRGPRLQRLHAADAVNNAGQRSGHRVLTSVLRLAANKSAEPDLFWTR